MTIGDRQRRRSACSGLVLFAMALFQSSSAQAASFDCNGRDLSETQLMICGDLELSRVDDQMGRRIRTLQRRQGLGLYLSIRYWSFRAADLRDACGRDRICVLSAYRAQGSALDRLQNCLDTNLRKRSCPRAVLGSEETVSKNSAGRP